MCYQTAKLVPCSGVGMAEDEKVGGDDVPARDMPVAGGAASGADLKGELERVLDEHQAAFRELAGR